MLFIAANFEVRDGDCCHRHRREGKSRGEAICCVGGSGSGLAKADEKLSFFCQILFAIVFFVYFCTLIGHRTSKRLPETVN